MTISTVPVGELMVKRVDDGLLSRFFLIYPDPVARDRPDEVPDQAVLMSALRRLRNLDLQEVDGGEPVPIAVSLVDDAVAVFEPWWKHNEQQGQVASGFLAAFLGKGPGLVLRTALILEFLTWAHSGSGPPPDRISKRSIEAACAFFEDYLVPMTERVYGGWRRISSRRSRTLAGPILARSMKPSCESSKADGRHVSTRAQRKLESGWRACATNS